jgi:hypothetical protein
MDNFEFRLCSYGNNDLKEAIEFIMDNTTATHCLVEDGTLTFFWGKPGPQTPNFPVPLDAEAVYPMAKKWLDEADYGEEPDIDGSCSKGFEMDGPPNDVWNKSIFSLKPLWAHHHK